MRQSPVLSRHAFGSVGKTCRRAARLMLLVVGLLLSAASAAADMLGDWRRDVAQTRQLVDNDAPRAYEQARRLQASLPPDAALPDKALILNLLARIEVTMASTREAAKHAQLALDLAERSQDRIGQAEANLNIALNSVNEGKIDLLVRATTRATEVLDGVDRPDLLGEALLRTAMMYRRLGQIDASLAMCMQAMEIARRINDPLVLTYAHQGLGVSYSQSDHNDQARDHFEQMRVQARAAHSKLLEAYALTSLGAVADLSDPQGAEAHFREATALYREVGAPFGLGHGLFSLADFLWREGRGVEAMPILDEVIAIYERYPNKIGLWYTLSARSRNYLAQGNRTAALSDAERAHAIAEDIGLYLYRGESAQRLATIFAAGGNYRRAYELSVEAADITAKAAREKISTQVVELAQRYESESKRRQIDELTRRNNEQSNALSQRTLQQRWLWTILVSSVAALLGASYFLLHLRRSHRALATVNTRLQTSQEELQQTTERLEGIVGNLPGVVFRVKRFPNGLFQFIYLNGDSGVLAHREILGLSPGELKEIFHRDDWPLLYEEVPRKLRQEGSCEYRFRFFLPNSSPRWYWSRERVIGWEDDAMIAEGLSLDVTDEMEAKEALDRQEAERRLIDKQLQDSHRLQELGQLAGGVAHDFNNLLGAILGFTEFILEDTAADNPVNSYAQRIQMAGRRGKGVIQQILTFAQRKETSRTRFRLADLAQETVDLLSPNIPSTTRFVLDIVDDGVTVEADYDQLGQAVLNLCLNAHDALSGNHGTVTISVAAGHDAPDRSDRSRSPPAGGVETWQDDDGMQWVAVGEATADRDYAYLMVSDSGCGMDATVLKRVFQPFFSTKPKSRGTGLGLSVVHSVVLANDGWLIVNSRVGGGTCFRIAIPSAGRMLDESAKLMASASGTITGRILLVDDDPDFGAMLDTALRRCGLSVDYVSNPIDALAALRAHRDAYDVMITDQTMPDMSGLDFVRAAREINAALPCLICTGYSESLTEAGAREAGAAALIQKPVDIENIVALLNTLIGTGQKRRKSRKIGIG